MANSKVASKTESKALDAGPIDGDYCRASAPSFELGWADGLRSPSTRSSVSQNASNCGAVLRDPEAILRGLLSCDVSVGAAVEVMLGYYKAANGCTAPDELSSASGTSSLRAIRTQRWHAEMSAWPMKKGFCYLLPVRWARRKRVGEALGPCPSMRDFISYIKPDDIDFELSNKVNVYRLPSVGNSTFVAYHMAESYEAGVKIGSFRAVVQSLLRSYPWLSGCDFGDDQILPGNLPLVGNLVVCDSQGRQLFDKVAASGIVESPDCAAVVSERELQLCVGARHDELLPERCVVRPPLHVALQSVTGDFPNEQENRALCTVIDGDIRLTVSLRVVVQGERLRIPVVLYGSHIWLVPPGTVDMTSSTACCFLRSSGDGQEQSFAVLRTTLCLHIEVIGGHDVTTYLWRALSASDLLMRLARDRDPVEGLNEQQVYDRLLHNPNRRLLSELTHMLRNFQDLDVPSVLSDVRREFRLDESATRPAAAFSAVMSDARLFRSLWR